MSEGCNLERPNVSNDMVSQILRQYYGLELTSLCKLPGYDDFTATVDYTVHVAPATDVQKGILKILGADSSSKSAYQHFIGSMLSFLSDEGLPVSAPIKCSDGSLDPPKIQLAHKDSVCQGHFVHMMSYIKGTTLNSEGNSMVDDDFLRDLGILVARLHGTVEKYSEALPEVRPSPWHLVDAHLLHRRLDAITLGKAEHEMVDKASKQFSSYLEEHRSSLKQCLLHGDINVDNIIVRKIEEDNSSHMEIAGLIDFGEMVHGPLVVDLAILTTSLHIQAYPTGHKLIHLSARILEAYCATSNTRFSRCELELFTHALSARFAQSIIMCKYDAKNDPENSDYLLADVDSSMSALKEFYSRYKSNNEFTNALADLLL